MGVPSELISINHEGGRTDYSKASQRRAGSHLAQVREPRSSATFAATYRTPMQWPLDLGMSDERTRKVIEHGKRIRAVLGQRQFAPLVLGEQVALTRYHDRA